MSSLTVAECGRPWQCFIILASYLYPVVECNPLKHFRFETIYRLPFTVYHSSALALNNPQVMEYGSEMLLGKGEPQIQVVFLDKGNYSRVKVVQNRTR